MTQKCELTILVYMIIAFAIKQFSQSNNLFSSLKFSLENFIGFKYCYG